MLPILPNEVLCGSWELICCMLTSVVAVMSYLFLLR